MPTYTGRVIDRLTGAEVYRSRHVSTWEFAQHRAERKAKGDRYAVRVVCHDPAAVIPSGHPAAEYI